MRDNLGVFYNSEFNNGYTMYMKLVDTTVKDCIDIGVSYMNADTSLHHCMFSITEVEEIIVLLQTLVNLAKKQGR